MKLRIFLLLGYWILASIVAFIFAGYGDGSLGPFAILVSWPGFVSTLLNQLLNLRGAGFFFEAFLIVLSLSFLYYFGLIRLVTRLSVRAGNSTYLIPRVIHLSGGLAFMVVLNKQYIFPPGILDSETLDWRAYWFLASYIVSLGITLIWLSIDWRLAKKDHARAKKSADNENR